MHKAKIMVRNISDRIGMKGYVRITLGNIYSLNTIINAIYIYKYACNSRL